MRSQWLAAFLAVSLVSLTSCEQMTEKKHNGAKPEKKEEANGKKHDVAPTPEKAPAGHNE